MFVDWMMAVLRFATVASMCPRIVPRDEWGARPPKGVVEMVGPVSTVVIHHTYSPAYCADAAACEAAMRSMQTFHQDDRGWDDIGYSFAVGGDGRVYKGRGWNRVGAHAPPYNQDSIGITLIGDWTAQAPPQEMLDAADWLIRCGVETGRIAEDYQLIGHRQAKANHTECPGDALYAALRDMPRWTDKPVPPKKRPSSPVAATVAVAAPALPPAAAVVAVPVEAVEVVEVATPSAAARAGTYDPSTPVASRDAVEVRQLNKRGTGAGAGAGAGAGLRGGSLWDRLVVIWQHEAARQQALAALEAQDNDNPAAS
ncbi:Peptidoglycan-recognition protein LB [Frankliniella fusca]|uniref:Peptidoglycan-recognition protein LB n=1 Tax=Frankliniella fusca TaxID=407009 RepID=A0AAE1LEP6_9NEOP|nr:Peptidoglycan-recognition protein LB [Frankliniella fusca]